MRSNTGRGVRVHLLLAARWGSLVTAGRGGGGQSVMVDIFLSFFLVEFVLLVLYIREYELSICGFA